MSTNKFEERIKELAGTCRLADEKERDLDEQFVRQWEETAQPRVVVMLREAAAVVAHTWSDERISSRGVTAEAETAGIAERLRIQVRSGEQSEDYDLWFRPDSRSRKVEVAVSESIAAKFNSIEAAPKSLTENLIGVKVSDFVEHAFAHITANRPRPSFSDSED